MKSRFRMCAKAVCYSTAWPSPPAVHRVAKASLIWNGWGIASKRPSLRFYVQHRLPDTARADGHRGRPGIGRHPRYQIQAFRRVARHPLGHERPGHPEIVFPYRPFHTGESLPLPHFRQLDERVPQRNRDRHPARHGATPPPKENLGLRPYDLPVRLWHYLIGKSGIAPDRKWNELGHKGLCKLADTLCNDRYDVDGRSTFREEVVTCGGVSPRIGATANAGKQDLPRTLLCRRGARYRRRDRRI